MHDLADTPPLVIQETNILIDSLHTTDLTHPPSTTPTDVPTFFDPLIDVPDSCLESEFYDPDSAIPAE